MMNSFDFLIIYLTCGAPLGVFYFLQNRKQQIGIRLWLKTFFTFVFWLPFGFRLLMKNQTNKKFFGDGKLFSKMAKTENEIFLVQSQFEEALQKSTLQISIFEFRKVFERYVGLTIAQGGENLNITEAGKEVFRIGNNGNVEIGAVCLNRRNLKRLTFHQTQARQDFFQVISHLVTAASDRKEFVETVADFLRLINDTEAQSALEKISFDSLQNDKSFAVNRSENYLWNTEIRKSPTAKSTRLQLQTLTARTNSSAKD